MIKKRKKVTGENMQLETALLPKVDPIVMEDLWRIMPPFEFLRPLKGSKLKKETVAKDREEGKLREIQTEAIYNTQSF